MATEKCLLKTIRINDEPTVEVQLRILASVQQYEMVYSSVKGRFLPRISSVMVHYVRDWKLSALPKSTTAAWWYFRSLRPV